jgi:hypothetical protein
MKRAWVAVVVVALMGAGVALGDVYSVNAVGYNTVTVPPTNLALATLAFESFGDSSVADLMGDQFLGGKLFIWDRTINDYIGITPGRGGWSSATNIVFRGDAFWLYNLSTTETGTVTFAGEVPYVYNNSATTTLFSVDGVEAVGYAYPTDMAWTNTTLSADPAVTKIHVWDEANQKYIGISPGRGGWSTSVVIPAGRAFWVEMSGAVDWTEVAPYTL